MTGFSYAKFSEIKVLTKVVTRWRNEIAQTASKVPCELRQNSDNGSSNSQTANRKTNGTLPKPTPVEVMQWDRHKIKFELKYVRNLAIRTD